MTTADDAFALYHRACAIRDRVAALRTTGISTEQATAQLDDADQALLELAETP